MIRPIAAADQQDYLEMCREFYSGDAVLHPVPERYFQRTFDTLMESDTYASAYIMEENDAIVGYALLAKTFSQEAGGMVIWIEELYIRPAYQGRGYGTGFFRFLEQEMGDRVSRLRLEYEPDNLRGAALYRRLGFTPLGYGQMVKELG